MQTMKTTIPKPDQIQRHLYLIDANGKILGRVAAKIAAILRGKNKTTFTPHLDTGDRVIVINAEKIRVTGNKMKQKTYQRYSGYPSGQKSLTLEQMMQKAPTQALRLAVNRMIPKGRLGNQLRKRLRIYAGDQHPHQAQKPVLLKV